MSHRPRDLGNLMNILEYTYGSEHWEVEGAKLTGLRAPSLPYSFQSEQTPPIPFLICFTYLCFEEDFLGINLKITGLV